MTELDDWLYEIHHANSLEVAEDIPDGTVDLLFTGAPYDISSEMNISRDGGGSWSGKDIGYDFSEEWEMDPIDFLSAFEHTLKENSVVAIIYDYLGVEQLASAMEELGWTVRQPFIWRKPNPTPQAFGVKWKEGFEMGLIATVNEGSGHTFQSELKQRDNVIECSNAMSEPGEHPTQKPVELFRTVIEWWSDESSVVLDPFMGSGTTAVACSELNRKWIGIEKEKEYVDMARNRVRHTRPREESPLLGL